MVSRERLNQVTTLLNQARIPFTLGGSGLLYACSLVESVNDWDLMTDCPYSEVVRALNGHSHVVKSKTDEFASEYALQLPDFSTEIIGSFRMNTRFGICKIPNHIFGWWDGEIPIRSPEAWFIAYKLMGRNEKAALLRKFIKKNGANPRIALVILAEPLPKGLRKEASFLFGM